MNDIQISLIASANRVKWWPRFYESLKGNKINFEIVFVGDTKPPFDLPENFKWIYATVKPAQCYQIGFWAAKGELIHWTADDATYGNNGLNCDNCLDIAYNKWKEIEAQYNDDKKTVIAMNPCEDGGYPQAKFHRFFGGWEHTPVMAPFGLIDREYFVNKLGGYDRDFVSGQSENDVVMRVFEDGGRVEMCLDSKLYVHHRQVHPRDPKDNRFREWYNKDREVLENFWIPAGYGNYEKDNQNVEISKTRLKPFRAFQQTIDVTTVTQGLQGRWSNEQKEKE